MTDSEHIPLTGVVLAGGASRRMGADKASLRRDDGASLLEHACACLAEVVDAVLVVGGTHAPGRARLVADAWPGAGPAGGVATALRHARAAVLVVPCDLPALSSSAIAWLARVSSEHPDAPAVVGRVRGAVQPLFAVYRPDAADELAARVDRGRRSLTGWISEADAAIIDVPDAFTDALTDVDTPQQWQAFRAQRRTSTQRQESDMTDVLIERDGAILDIAMNRPRRKNALTLAMYDAMTEAIEDASTDPSVRVIVLRGEGGSFTSGNDLKDFQQSPPSDENSPVFRFLKALIRCPKPVLAAVDGVAVGIGTTMLLHCDMAWAADDTVFQMPFVNLAVVPEAGSSYLLPRMVGHQRAAELLMLGDRFDTATAQEIGIVNGGLAAQDVLAHVRERAAALATKPPEAIRLTKRLLRQRYGDTLEETLSDEARLFVERLHSPEFHEAIDAFFNKRAPDFSRFE